MQGPNAGFREHIAKRIDGLETVGDPERELDTILANIQDVAGNDPASPVDSVDAAYRELGAIEAWASLASDAFQAVYESRSPNLLKKMGKKVAGSTEANMERLRRIAGEWRDPLREVARALGGVGFGVGIGFPGGISISISYTF
jgi:hypothetical protein